MGLVITFSQYIGLLVIHMYAQLYSYVQVGRTNVKVELREDLFCSGRHPKVIILQTIALTPYAEDNKKNQLPRTQTGFRVGLRKRFFTITIPIT